MGWEADDLLASRSMKYCVLEVFRKEYSKTVLGCKNNRRYEMGVQKIVFRGLRLRKRIF